MTEQHHLIINCGDATHTVEVNADALQRVRCTLVDHDEELDQVLRALGAERSACQRAADAVRNLRHDIPSVATRIQWVETGVLDVQTYEQWCDIGAPNPGVVRNWVSALTRKGSPPLDLAQAPPGSMCMVATRDHTPPRSTSVGASRIRSRQSTAVDQGRAQACRCCGLGCSQRQRARRGSRLETPRRAPPS